MLYTDSEIISTAIYGEILHAVDTFTKDHIAIKKMQLLQIHRMESIEAYGSQQVYENAIQEAQVNQIIMSQGGHPNIVRLREKYCDKNWLYLVFDYYPKGDLLQHVMSRRRPMTIHKALTYFHQITQGVAHLHSMGKCHRDLSLENVLLSDENQAVICDFGLACDLDTLQSDRVGKDFYRAPEVSDATTEYDPAAADMWSLGIILFILLTGQPLLESTEAANQRFQLFQRYGMKRYCRQSQVDLSKPCRKVLEQLLHLNPAKRPTIKQLCKLIHGLRKKYSKYLKCNHTY